MGQQHPLCQLNSPSCISLTRHIIRHKLRTGQRNLPFEHLCSNSPFGSNSIDVRMLAIHRNAKSMSQNSILAASGLHAGKHPVASSDRAQPRPCSAMTAWRSPSQMQQMTAAGVAATPCLMLKHRQQSSSKKGDFCHQRQRKRPLSL